MPAVARIGDLNVVHCSSSALAVGSGSVFANGRPVTYKGCPNTTHLLPGGRSCGSHQGTIAAGSGTVFVQGEGIGRLGDAMTGCTLIAEGSDTVFAGG